MYKAQLTEKGTDPSFKAVACSEDFKRLADSRCGPRMLAISAIYRIKL